MRSLPGAALVLAGVLAATTARADSDAGGEPVDRGIDEPVDAPPAGPIPQIRWYTLETPHFDLHYYPAEREFAERAARIAERAYRLNTRYLNWRPSGPISITLLDHTDDANGFASSVPFNWIVAYSAPPGSLDELSDFDDYVKLLITHEMTHVVHLDTMLSWCPRLVNTVLGKAYAPNLAQATWFIEGLAVLMETRQTTAGRLRSSLFDMFLRVPFLEGKQFGMDAVSASPLAFPGPSVPYLYGSSVLRYLEDRYGPEKLREISHRYADECIAGGMNRVAADALGRGYVEPFGDGVWEEWKHSTAHRFALETEAASRRGLTTARRLTHTAPGPRGEGPGARFFHDGTLVYHRANNDQQPAYVRLDLATGAQHTLADAYGGGPATPTPDGRALIFQRLDFIPIAQRIAGNSHLGWNDLFRRDLANGSVRQLTRHFRGKEPDVSPDGTQIACVVARGGARELALVPIDGGVPRVLTPDAQGFAYTPAFSPDGRLIAYSRWKPGGLRDIQIFDLAARIDRAVMVDRAMDIDPRFSPDGRFLLFSSDRTGIYNIYAYELSTKRLFQVTNVLEGAFQPTVSPDGKQLVFTGFTHEGFDLYVMPFEPARFLDAQPYANARLDPSPDPDAESDSPDASPADAAAVPFVTRTTSYRPWLYIYPRKWDLRYYSEALGLGGTVFLGTQMQDPAQHHTINVQLLIPGTDISAEVDYTYQRFWPSFQLALRRTAQEVSGLVVDGVNTNYRQLVLGTSAVLGLPILRMPADSADLSFGYDYTAYGPTDPFPLADPSMGATHPPETGPDADLFVAWSFSNAQSWPYSISSQTGRRLDLYLRISDPTLGGRFHTTEVTWSWAEFLTPPWARLHAVGLLYRGGAGVGDRRNVFALGGFPSQDTLRTIFLNQRGCCVFLRGYPAYSIRGDAFEAITAEYRLPLVWIERGYQTFPLYFRRIWGAAFFDAGDAYVGAFHPSNLKTDVGVEAHLQFNVAYFLESEVQIGFAHGFQAPGGNQLYFLAAASF
jgi:Tol biopolymer transport system component